MRRGRPLPKSRAEMRRNVCTSSTSCFLPSSLPTPPCSVPQCSLPAPCSVSQCSLPTPCSVPHCSLPTPSCSQSPPVCVVPSSASVQMQMCCAHAPYNCVTHRQRPYWCNYCVSTFLFPELYNNCTLSSAPSYVRQVCNTVRPVPYCNSNTLCVPTNTLCVPSNTLCVPSNNSCEVSTKVPTACPRNYSIA